MPSLKNETIYSIFAYKRFRNRNINLETEIQKQQKCRNIFAHNKQPLPAAAKHANQLRCLELVRNVNGGFRQQLAVRKLQSSGVQSSGRLVPLGMMWTRLFAYLKPLQHHSSMVSRGIRGALHYLIMARCGSFFQPGRVSWAAGRGEQTNSVCLFGGK